MKIKREIVYLLLIILLAGILRFYKLGSFPSLFNDEAAVGYNAWSILKTGRDEFGVKFPIFFKSFGEGKLPLYIYEAVIPVAIFGLNEFSCRFMPALLGTLTVPILYFFTKELLNFHRIKDKKLKKYLPLMASLFLTTMPWHINLSRGVFGHESLFWILLGVYFSIKFLNQKILKYWLATLLSFCIALMTYHAAKVFVPLWIIYILLIKWKSDGFKKMLKLAILALAISGSIWLWMSNSKIGNTRTKDVSIFGNEEIASKMWEASIQSQGQPVWLNRFFHNKVEYSAKYILRAYFSHFDPEILFFVGDLSNPRTNTPYFGKIFLIFLPLLAIGLYFLVKKKLWIIFIFLLISPIASSLTFDFPNMVRTVYMTAPLSLIMALGFLEITRLIKKSWGIKIFLLIFGLIFTKNLLAYTESYYVHQSFYNAREWQFGIKEILGEVNQITEQEKDKYNDIYITRDLGGTPYIFYLFFNKYDPTKWQIQANQNISHDEDKTFIHIEKIDNIEFLAEGCPNRHEDVEDSTLYVCKSTPHLRNIMNIKKVFYWPNEEESYVITDKKH